MSFFELLLVGVGLSMDAFAAAICRGLCVERLRMADSLKVGLYFGGFQALMPLIGYFAGVYFAEAVERWDHWIAFVLLAFIGGKMIWESRQKEDCAQESCDASLSPGKMLPLAVATSIDALAVGISFAFLRVNITEAVLVIGGATLLISAAGVWIGHAFGAKYKASAELAGGIILILIGGKILLEHLEILGL